MRIAVVGPTHPFRGGIAHYTALLARHLRERHDVLFISFSRQYPRLLFPGRTDRDPSASTVHEPAERILAPLLPWTWWRSARAIARFAPDLVIVQWWSPFWTPSLASVVALVRRSSPVRIVFVCHNVLPHEGPGRASRALTRLALRRGDAFVVHGDADERMLRTLLPEAVRAGRPIVRGVLPAHTIATPVDRSAARSALGLPADASVALFFGFVRPYKDLPNLIDALPAALSAVPDLHLVVAGEFWEPVARFRARADALGVGGRVRLDDRYVPNEEVGTYFAAADVVVLPYAEASQSGVVTVASEFGLPIVATRVGGLPDVVVDGETGLLVPPGDPAAIAGALARALGDPALRAHLARGVADGRARFGWNRVVRLFEDLAPAGEPGEDPSGT